MYNRITNLKKELVEMSSMRKEIKLHIDTRDKINKLIDNHISGNSKFRITSDGNDFRVYEMNLINNCVNKECNNKYFYLNVKIMNDYLDNVYVEYIVQDHCLGTIVKSQEYDNFDEQSLDDIKGTLLEHIYYCESCVNDKEWSCCENFFENK